MKTKVAVSFTDTYDDWMPIDQLVLMYKKALAEVAYLRIQNDRLMRAESNGLRGKQNYRLKYEQLAIRHKELLCNYAKAIGNEGYDPDTILKYEVMKV